MSSFILLLPLLLFYFENARTITYNTVFFLVVQEKKKINATHKCHPSCWCLISIQVISNVCKPTNDPYTNNEHIHKIQSQSQKLFLTLAHGKTFESTYSFLTENLLRFCDYFQKYKEIVHCGNTETIFVYHHYFCISTREYTISYIFLLYICNKCYFACVYFCLAAYLRG